MAEWRAPSGCAQWQLGQPQRVCSRYTEPFITSRKASAFCACSAYFAVRRFNFCRCWLRGWGWAGLTAGETIDVDVPIKDVFDLHILTCLKSRKKFSRILSWVNDPAALGNPGRDPHFM